MSTIIKIIDPVVTDEPIKPVNGVGQPPMVGAMNGWPMLQPLDCIG